MILYFSGTGNSRYVAEQLAAGTGNSLHFMPKYNPLKIEFEGKQLGIVVPVYSWGISPYVLDFIRDLNSRFIDEAAKHPVWFVLTCGDETAYAPEMMKRSLSEKGIMIAGGWSVIMPNDYVLLPGFDVDSKEVEENKLDECRVRIDYIAGRINALGYIPEALALDSGVHRLRQMRRSMSDGQHRLQKRPSEMGQ